MKKTIPTPDSSNIANLQYDDETLELRVQFQKGGVYAYKDVPEEVFTMLSSAESVGSAFHTLIKSAGYEYEKVGGLEDTMTI